LLADAGVVSAVRSTAVPRWDLSTSGPHAYPTSRPVASYSIDEPGFAAQVDEWLAEFAPDLPSGLDTLTSDSVLSSDDELLECLAAGWLADCDHR
jgi:hypothetical protein